MQEGQLKPGELFEGKYEIIQVIGAGGIGAVYMARESGSGRICAVKEQILKAYERARIRTEINIQSRLDHPALPKLYSVIEKEERIYIVMEYIRGVTLAELIDKENSFPEERVRRWALQLCDILRYLHNLPQPVVYRDLKPSNIMIGPQDELHLIDFGIAIEYRDWNNPDRAVMLTRGYAAPEQYDSRYASDARTDLYSLGVTLHYLLTGKKPTEAPYVFRRIRSYDNKLSRAMDEIVRCCLQPRPDQRFESADALYTALSDIDARERSIRRKRLAMALAGVLSLLILIMVLTLLGISLKKKREERIEAYYTLLDEADDALLGGDFDRAEGLLREASELEPEAEDADIRMLGVYFGEGRYDEAFAYVSDELLDRYPDLYGNRMFLEYMVKLYTAVGDTEEADYYMEKIEKLGEE